MIGATASAGPCLFTIGHSNHSLEAFLGLLKSHGIEVLVDVRSHPYSKYASHFNTDTLKTAVTDSGVKYLYLGKELGGRPPENDFYDADGHVLYGRVAETALFLRGIERLEQGAGQYRVAMMCSEEDPVDCHRHLLVGRVLAGRGTALAHIRGDGRVQTDAELQAENEPPAPDRQKRLFDDEPETPVWRSIRSVLPKKQPPSSSES